MHYEHLVNVETGEVTEFYHLVLETVKEQIKREMGHKPVDQRLESFGCKLKSCPLSAKSLRHKVLAHRRFVVFAYIVVLVFVHRKKARSIYGL